MKKIVSAVLVFVMMLSLAGCGISYDDIKGDWTAKTINGMTIDEYAASLGVDPSQATVNVNITEDDKMTMVTANGETKFDYERRSDGIEVKMEGKDEIYMQESFGPNEGLYWGKPGEPACEFNGQRQEDAHIQIRFGKWTDNGSCFGKGKS